MKKNKVTTSQERILNIIPLKRNKKLFGLFSQVTGNQMKLKQNTWISPDNVKEALLQWVQSRVLYRSVENYRIYIHYFNESDPEETKLFKVIYAITHDSGFVICYEAEKKNAMVDSVLNRPANGKYLIATRLFENPKDNLIWFETLEDIVDFLLRTYYEIKEIENG